LLCTYTFHIVNDVCWPQCDVKGKFWINEMKMSDSCTQDLDPCDPINAYWKFFPAEPEVYIKPDEDINCVVGEEVTYTVEVHNITKMKSLHFTIKWKGNKVTNPYETVWLAILKLKEVIINEDVFPEANRTDSIVIFNNPANTTSHVKVDIVMDCTYPLINTTEPDYKLDAVYLVFEKKDPWWCGRQPGYDIDLETHEMKPDNATTPIWFDSGYIDVMCPEYKKIYFGTRNRETFTTYEPGWDIVTDYYPADVTVDVYGDCKTKWTFDMIGDKVLVGDGHWGVDVAIFDCTGNPLYKVHNNDGWTALFPVGAWLYSPWVPGVGYDEATTELVSDVAGISATGDRWIAGNPEGIFTVTIEDLGPKYCYALWIGVGGFWANPDPPPDHNGYSSYPDGFYWGPWDGYWGPLGPIECVAKSSFNEAKFTFMPVPGDLTGDGLVDIKDLTAIAAKYCTYWDPWPGTWEKFFAAYYYDFNKDGHIDIFDIIVVSKNWERSCPF